VRADRNRPQRSLLLMRERISKLCQVSRAVETENVGQLQLRRFMQQSRASTSDSELLEVFQRYGFEMVGPPPFDE
jgi:hypothetical protein